MLNSSVRIFFKQDPLSCLQYSFYSTRWGRYALGCLRLPMLVSATIAGLSRPTFHSNKFAHISPQRCPPESRQGVIAVSVVNQGGSKHTIDLVSIMAHIRPFAINLPSVGGLTTCQGRDRFLRLFCVTCNNRDMSSSTYSDILLLFARFSSTRSSHSCRMTISRICDRRSMNCGLTLW